MTAHAAVNAFVGLGLMLAIGVGYVMAARRFRTLWHPLAIVFAVTTVSVVVSLVGELVFRGPSGIPAMLRRSAIGGFGWGVVIAAVVWIGRRLFARTRGARLRQSWTRAR